LVLEARRLVDDPKNSSSSSSSHGLLTPSVVQALNALDYPLAAQHVYGMTYDDWKQRYQKKATPEQLDQFQKNTALHAQHDAQLLAAREVATTTTTAPSSHQHEHDHHHDHHHHHQDTEKTKKAVPLSNVCCQDMDTPASSSVTPVQNITRTVTAYQPAPLPDTKLLPSPLRVAVLTVSDRAARNEYTSGDLSGPAMVQALQALLPATVVENMALVTAIVPDEMDAIQTQLQTWCSTGAAAHDDDGDSGGMHLILTTGGTGMSPRDVTPEATRAVLTLECPGLMAFVATECSRQFQPLAALTRGTAGIVHGTTMIANLPGNPKAMGEILPLLLPLLLHAVVDLRRSET